ncbi:LamG-like jellyroll fold domain-containing protein [Clostridium oryzae]|uniref:Exochitinase 1 n=1 Tax=Clostridium oryzae TaxID=1450648 RepID=A0A1V4IVG7_9CLOT|nr:LamG-like jellyroll fold domain-containing protein [Clostridium oryzae]OPJ63820.1 exochitinase 1 precursor [Clostridium oryzae]
MFTKKAVSILTAFMLSVTTAAAMPVKKAHANTAVTANDLLLWYKFNSTSGTAITDYSGNDYNGTLVGGASWAGGGDSVKLDGTDGYVKLPNGIFKSQNNITISTLVKINKNITNSWIFGLGTDSSKYIMLNSQTKDTGGVTRGAITTGSWQSEQAVQNTSVLPIDVWTNVTLVISGDTNTETLYVDGMQVGQNTKVTIKPADVYSESNAYSGYIGKSLYSGDPYLNGQIADFRIYSKALSADEVKAITVPVQSPKAPTELTAEAENTTEISLDWTGSSKAVGYNLYRAEGSSNTYSKIYSGNASTYLDKGLTPDTTYSYKVSAYNSVGESEVSDVVQAETYACNAPTHLRSDSIKTDSALLKWHGLKGDNVIYKLTRSTSKDGAYVQVYSGKDKRFRDTGLIEATAYYYKISASVDEKKSTTSEPLGLSTKRVSFTPDAVMLDRNGNPIDAHGAGITYDSKTKKYYWYGEYHAGSWPSAGVKVYSSTDLYNWKDEGMALTEISSKDQFKTDPLISKLYGDRTDTDNIWADIRVGRIIERPKVIYNDKTKKYVMWMHIDGDKNPNNNAQNYGKAQAGCAVSNSPVGPFVYQASYRMDQCPADQTDYQPGNPGMARDMNLFKDDNGTAYLIYSSEENCTIYISKLTNDYLDVTGWHKDGNVDSNGKAIRDTTYKGVYGVDYIRLFAGSKREAPAMFKYNGKYYLLTSGATGWTANENEYATADNILGTWSTMENPFVRTASTDPDPNKAFNSQTACVIPVDAAKGKFIYVGDDWNGGNFSSNGGAKYVFLPIDFGQGTDMTIKWYSKWDLSILDNSAAISVNTNLPKTYTTGSTLTLPDSLQVTQNGKAIATPVTWKLDTDTVTCVTFSNPGLYTLQAVLPKLNNKIISFKIYSIPENVQYFVNCSGYATSDYNLMTSYMQGTLINKSVVDQQYNQSDAVPWGYVGSNTKSSGSSSGDIFSTLRYLNGGNVTKSSAGTDLTYKFTVKNGSYTVYTGFNDIWSNSSRKADLYINGVKKNAITFISNTVYKNTVDVTDGTIDVTVRNTEAQDPLINWIMISAGR